MPKITLDTSCISFQAHDGKTYELRIANDGKGRVYSLGLQRMVMEQGHLVEDDGKTMHLIDFEG